MRSVKILVHGRVQGVFYRQNTRTKAMELGVQGTVRNLDDGSVEIFAEADPESLELFISWCKIGPERARVDKIDIHEHPLKNYSGFLIIR